MLRVPSASLERSCFLEESVWLLLCLSSPLLPYFRMNSFQLMKIYSLALFQMTSKTTYFKLCDTLPYSYEAEDFVHESVYNLLRMPLRTQIQICEENKGITKEIK